MGMSADDDVPALQGVVGGLEEEVSVVHQERTPLPGELDEAWGVGDSGTREGVGRVAIPAYQRQ